MAVSTSARYQGRGATHCHLTIHQSAPPQRCFNLETTSDTTTISPVMSLSPDFRATTATFNTAELLEQILSHLPASQLLTSKATSRSFRSAIEASPTLRRKTSTFLRFGDVDGDDVFNTNAGGEVVFPIKGLDPLAFFYPSKGEKRLFVRFSVADLGLFERMGKAEGFGRVVVVDQALSCVMVGWHCGCSADVMFEVKLSCQKGMVTFGDVLNAMEVEHRSKVYGVCGSTVKFWLDGLWKHSKEVGEVGC
jgi:hypothetical protein